MSQYNPWRVIPDHTEGFVYVMVNRRNGYHKIGFTSSKPEYREKTLQAEEPEIDLLFACWADFGAEADLHERFAKFRVRGEWFNLSPLQVMVIKQDLWMFAITAEAASTMDWAEEMIEVPRFDNGEIDFWNHPSEIIRAYKKQETPIPHKRSHCMR